jgi:transcriptional regulator with XRE-family HTH domain
MPTLLQTRLKHLMQEKSLRTSDLEKLAGLKISGVRNILLGKTKHPKAETLQAIAEVLNCTVADLLGKEVPLQEEVISSPQLEHPHLFLQSVKTFLSLLEQEKSNFTLDEAWLVIKETYLYSSQKNPKVIDDQFAKWVFAKQKQS